MKTFIKRILYSKSVGQDYEKKLMSFALKSGNILFMINVEKTRFPNLPYPMCKIVVVTV